MQFTGTLGSQDAGLRWIVLGFGVITSGATYDVSASFSSTDGFTPSVGESYDKSITLSSTNTFASMVGESYSQTLTMGQTAGFSDIADANTVVSFSGTNTFAVSDTLILPTSVTFTGHNVFASVAGFRFDVSFLFISVNSFQPVNGLAYQSSVTFAGTNTFLPGVGWEATITFAGTASFSPDFLYLAGGINLFNTTSTFAVDVVKNPGGLAHNTLVINQTVSVQLIVNHTATNTLVLQGIAAWNRVLQRVTSSHLFLNQQVLRVWPNTCSQTFTITQTIAKTKVSNQSVANAIHFIGTVVRNYTFILNINQTLVFKNRFTKFISLDQQTIEILNVIFAVVPANNCTVVMELPDRVIVLPCPRFGDTEGYSGGEVTIKHSITGTTRTYVKRTDLRKLKYTFQLQRLKSLELKQFVLNSIGKIVKMTNWKGEVWLVHISSAPYTMTNRGRWGTCSNNDQMDVTLEFEGVKIAG